MKQLKAFPTALGLLRLVPPRMQMNELETTSPTITIHSVTYSGFRSLKGVLARDAQGPHQIFADALIATSLRYGSAVTSSVWQYNNT